LKNMQAISMATLLVVAAANAPSALANNCEQVKSDIAAKIDANGVPSYSLTVVDAGAAHDGKVVGQCGGNTKRIVYVRGGGGASEPAPSPSVEPAAAADPATDAAAPAAEAPESQ
jgi:hypothetical protein